MGIGVTAFRVRDCLLCRPRLWKSEIVAMRASRPLRCPLSRHLLSSMRLGCCDEVNVWYMGRGDSSGTAISGVRAGVAVPRAVSSGGSVGVGVAIGKLSMRGALSITTGLNAWKPGDTTSARFRNFLVRVWSVVPASLPRRARKMVVRNGIVESRSEASNL